MSSENALLSFSELRSLTYYAVLKWCAADDGCLRRDRLERVAAARRYSGGWVKHNAGKQFADAWQTVAEWHAARRAAERRRRG